MKVESYTPGRVRFRFENQLEKRNFVKNIDSLKGIEDIKETANSLTIKFEADSQFDYFLKNFIMPSIRSMKIDYNLDKEDIFFYINPLIKNNITKAFWNMLILGPKRGFITFTICSLGVGPFIKNKL
ncbi:MAG: hypothetical protein JHC31_12850 [Sulfurihydrogenibium sp.]|jgi:hypothetical protein|nr:hypothetical protein [Sulfurihydrogenibium sp.]